MSSNQTAEAILIVIKRLLKWTFCGAGLIIISLLILGPVSEYYTYDRHKNKVILKASFNITKCPKDFPMLIEIKNNSAKTVKNINFSVEVTKTGRSTKLNDYYSYNSDLILKPKTGYWSCWKIYQNNSYYIADKLPLTGEDMEVYVNYYRVNFAQ